jgi:peptide/nickel transport system permease protein
MPAMAGLVYILFAVLIGILGYSIMPDATPDANDGAIQINKKPPGFEVVFLKMRKNQDIRPSSWPASMVFGIESPYILVPITGYKIQGMEVKANLYGKSDYHQTYNLLNVVEPLSIDHPDKVNISGTGTDTLIRYVDVNGNRKTIHYPDLLDRFHSHHIEKRKYILGTDRAGRDLLSRLLYGTRVSLSIGFMAVLISMIIGLGLGALAGFFGGWIDAFIMWMMSVVWSIPGIMLVIAISMALQARGYWVAFVAVGLTMWVEVARIVRGQIMAMREKQFVEAARAFGVKNSRIVFTHILPNIMGPLIVVATINFASAILLEAGLSFLGLSVQPPTPSWGSMIYEGFQAVGTRDSAHLILFPSAAISIIVLAFNMFGNGLRDAYDPKTQSY